MLTMRLVSALALCVLLTADTGRNNRSDGAKTGTTQFRTPYKVIRLDTGLIHYGEVTGLDSDYPVVRDVYYIQRATNPQTKQTSNMLVRRGNEWHGPEMTVFNFRHIVLVEPVGLNSKVLIAEQEKKQTT
jgi:hypothetical protein